MRSRVDVILYVLLGLILLAVCVIRAYSEKNLINYRVPLVNCLEEVELIGCDQGHPPKCLTSRVRFKSEKCLELVANAN